MEGPSMLLVLARNPAPLRVMCVITLLPLNAVQLSLLEQSITDDFS